MSQLLFEEFHSTIHALPFDGQAIYYGKQFKPQEEKDLFHELFQQVQWQRDQVSLFGKTHVTDRKMALYGNEGHKYNYSGKTHEALPWIEPLLQLKQLTENLTHATYNACLLNLYHSGNESMGWHADNEREMKVGGSIASWSFGVQRPFVFKHRKSGEKRLIDLEPGSLLEMKGETQENWLHQLPKRLRISAPRINVTFREMIVG
jgi:alkylated DNA repair dioxygenase AlkB